MAVASFSLAVNKTWVDDKGQKQDKTTWFRVTTWRKQAEIVNQYLQKGRQVMVIGEIEEARPYTNRDGKAAASLEVTATVVKFIGAIVPGEPTKIRNLDEDDYEGAPLGEADIPF